MLELLPVFDTVVSYLRRSVGSCSKISLSRQSDTARLVLVVNQLILRHTLELHALAIVQNAHGEANLLKDPVVSLMAIEGVSLNLRPGETGLLAKLKTPIDEVEADRSHREVPI